MPTHRTSRTPDRPPRRRSKPDWAPRFLAALAKTGVIRYACQASKIGRTTFYDRKRTDPAFAEAVTGALEDACDQLALKARRRAMQGSDQLLMFLLRSHRPETYR